MSSTVSEINQNLSETKYIFKKNIKVLGYIYHLYMVNVPENFYVLLKKYV